MSQIIKIVAYKAGNIASVRNAFARLGTTLQMATSPEDIATADKVIFPGVGHARPAMENLKNSGMADALRSYPRPVLGICLGMQLMASLTEEGRTAGLGFFSEKIIRFQPNLKVPHMGWNDVSDARGPLFKGIPDGSHFYFVHSYYMPVSNEAIALCHYHVPFTAAVASSNYFGVQFHPEKSGDAGATLLKNFIEL
jgi:imidazole glycerol-phosphate synthase subunit HisH